MGVNYGNGREWVLRMSFPHSSSSYPGFISQFHTPSGRCLPSEYRRIIRRFREFPRKRSPSSVTVICLSFMAAGDGRRKIIHVMLYRLYDWLRRPITRDNKETTWMKRRERTTFDGINALYSQISRALLLLH